MVRYRFEGVVTRKRAGELLTELRKDNTNIVGCLIVYADRAVEVDFEKEPAKEELEAVKTKLGATNYSKVEEEMTGI